MKEQNENEKSHTSVRNKKLYMYVALGCAAVLLARQSSSLRSLSPTANTLTN
ncbi:MAG: hypothetical protein ACLRSW_10395 [Christensenellaceae bacterium]